MLSAASQGNPAQRLHDLLVDLTKLPSGLSAHDAWQKVLRQVDSDLLMSFGAVYGLPQEVRTWWPLLESKDEDVADFEVAIGKIEALLARQGLHGTQEAYKKGLSPEVLLGLKSTAGAIRRSDGRDPVLAIEEIEDLLQQVQLLTKELRVATDLDPEVRRFAITHLLAIERTIRLLQVQGAEAARIEVSRFLGDLVMARQAGQDTIWHFVQDDTGLGGRIWGLLNRLAILTTVAGLPQLTAVTLRALEG